MTRPSLAFFVKTARCFLLSLTIAPLLAQGVETCRAELKGDTLVIENAWIARKYLWNGGNLVTRSLHDKKSGKVWRMGGTTPDLALPGQSEKAQNAAFAARVVPQTAVAPEHLEAEVTHALGRLEIKRVFRVYPTAAAIACDLHFRGSTAARWLPPDANLADLAVMEKLPAGKATEAVPVLEKLDLSGRHWKLDAVEFFDVTDRFNNLVREVSALSYRPNLYRGNLLFAHDQLSGNGLFLLKEAPASHVQLAYPGGDFLTEFGNLRVVGSGINPADLHPTEWRRGYGFVTGVYAGGEPARLRALREYQRNLRRHLPGRDEMVLMNTWGDRGQDRRVGEKFALEELEAGAKLGITHLQLDDGWQAGRSGNSAFAGGSFERMWNNPNYWTPNPARFPNGLGPVVKRGKELGIEIAVWFTPSRDSSNRDWEKDAAALVLLYRQHGIRTFKIDGVNLPDKVAETNFRKFLDRVSAETDHNAVFNLDVTAQRRGGYHYLNTYGNIFLENRYTDWTNYYPYTTLRNLWQLSKYVPPQNLQIEFLNKWRNRDKYPADDAFAPKNYAFDYLFAIAMVAQPLAWFEGTGLPAEAFSTGQLVRTYRRHQTDLHAGQIFPIGSEPSGTSWTGFQSIANDREGHLLVFREATPDGQRTVRTWLPAGKRVRLEPVAGARKAVEVAVTAEGGVPVSLPTPNSFGWYRYRVLN